MYKNHFQLVIALLLFTSISLSANGQEKVFYFTTSDSVRLYVRIAGDGAPCLFLHGGPGYTSYVFEATPAAKLLEQQQRMIYFDQRGGGRSGSAKNGDYSMKRMEKDIEELRWYLKIEKWAILGHSFAGLVETAYAGDFPDHVTSLVYMHCILDLSLALQSHIQNGLNLLRQAGDNYQPVKTKSDFDEMMNVHKELAKKGIEYKIMFSSQYEQNVEDSLANASTAHFNQDFQHYVWAMADYRVDYTPYSKDIKCPVLIITGSKDYAVGPESYKLWHFPNSSVVVYQGAHHSYQEQPKWFASFVKPFLAKYNQ